MLGSFKGTPAGTPLGGGVLWRRTVSCLRFVLPRAALVQVAAVRGRVYVSDAPLG